MNQRLVKLEKCVKTADQVDFPQFSSCGGYLPGGVVRQAVPLASAKAP